MAELSRAVFLSYASQDTEAAQRICEALRAAGVEVWFDQSELRGGDAWIKRSAARFATARCHSHHLLEHHIAARRLLQAGVGTGRATRANDRAKQGFIVPVCVDATPESAADVPESFVRVQWTRLPEGATPPSFAGRIRHLLQPELAAAPAPAPAPALAPAQVQAQPPPKKTHTVAVLAAAVVIIAVVVFALDRLVLWKRNQPKPAWRPRRPHDCSRRTPEKSIAVLPSLT